MINLYKSFIKKYLRLLISYLIIYSLIFSNTTILLAQNINQQDKGINIDYSQHNPFINGDTPTIGPQSNGVDVINISKPTAEGVSHNKFTDFNVNENGLIINNLNFQQYSGNAQSVLSGQHVEFNRNFGTGNAAKIILSEVTGTDISTLKGYTEIYGQQADYIIANPNGITCIGCGFINVNRLSIIAGSSNIENGEIETFDLSPNAMIKIEGIGDNDFGMNISGSPADIVASAIKIKGNIYSDNAINLLTGNNSYNFKTKEVSSNATTKNNNIDIAVDSSAIGGVYAGKIKIYTSQKGLGVNIDGDLVSNLDDIEITSDGDIQYKKAVSNNNIKIKSESGSITQKDKSNYAKNSIILESNKDINIDSDYIYTQNVKIKSDYDINANTKLIADNDINLIAKNNILNSDKILSGNEILLISGNEILNKGEINNQGKNLTLISENNITNASTIITSGLLNISAKNNLENQSLISSNDEGYFYSNNLKNYGKIKSANNITFDTLNALINYKNSGILSGKGILFKTGNNLINYSSEIYANEDITFMGQDGQYKKGPDPILSGDLEEIYKNPFIENIPDKEITDRPLQQIGDNNTDTILKLSTGYDLILDPNLIPEDGYELGKSYKTKDGYTIIIGKEIIKGDEITYEDNTQLTVKDLNGNTISYTFDDDINIDLPKTNISYVKDTIVNNDKLNEEIKNKLSIEASHISLDINNLRKDFNKAKKDMENVQSSIKQLENKIKYIENNTTYSDLWKLKEIKELEEEIKEAKQLLDLSVLNFTKASYSLSMAIANLGTSISTLGFTGNIKGELSKYSDNSTSDIVNTIGSNIQSKGNIIVNADNMEQKGSELISSNGNILYNIAKDLIFSAVENKSNNNISSSNINIGFNIGNSSGVSGYSNLDKTKETEDVLIYNYSKTTANNGSIIYNVGKNMSGIGYQAEGKNIIADIKGNMELVSLQNEYKLKGKSFGFGANGSDSSAGFSLQNGKTNINRLWTDDISFIKGSESVDINIGENLSMKGSLIASIKDGIDMGNLSISANELIWEDIKNYFETKSQNISKKHLLITIFSK